MEKEIPNNNTSHEFSMRDTLNSDELESGVLDSGQAYIDRETQKEESKILHFFRDHSNIRVFRLINDGMLATLGTISGSYLGGSGLKEEAVGLGLAGLGGMLDMLNVVLFTEKGDGSDAH